MDASERICVFIHFSMSNQVPYNVKIYIKELSRYFDQVYFLSNNSASQHDNQLFKDNIIFVADDNIGYDFGRVYNFIKKLNLSSCSQLALVNDSNLLLTTLEKVIEWGNNSNLDYWGLIDSYEKPWFSTHHNNYHIQSHFIVLHKRAITLLDDYYKMIDIENLFSERDKNKLRKKVINDWEIGLSQFLLSKNLNIGSFKSCKDYYQPKDISTKVNVAHKYYFELIKNDYPLLKKKVITLSKWHHRFLYKQPWRNSVYEYVHPSFKYDVMLNEVFNL